MVLVECHLLSVATIMTKGVNKMDIEDIFSVLGEYLSIDGQKSDRVRFDVKGVESCQDFASVSEVYTDDGELVVVLR